MKRRFYNSLWLLALYLLLGGYRLEAASITNPDENLLRAAIQQAAPGETIVIDLPLPTSEPIYFTNLNGTILTNSQNVYHNTLALTNGPLVIDKDLTILGTEGANNPILDAGGLSRIFDIRSGKVVLQNLVLANGNSTNTGMLQGGAAIYNLGDLTVNSCSFLSNSAFIYFRGIDKSGGAIYSQGTLTVYKSGFTNNVSTANGAAICNLGTAIVRDSIFTGGDAYWLGGAIANFGTLKLSGSLFLNNFSRSLGGGALGNGSNAVATIVDSSFHYNVNSYAGGGAIINSGRLYVTNSLFRHNVSNKDFGNSHSSGGGAICNLGGFINLTTCMIESNSAFRGGGIFNYGTVSSNKSEVTLNACTLQQNGAFGFGGGMANLANGGPATANLTNCTLSQNSVDRGTDVALHNVAGGLDNCAYDHSATVHLMNCTLVNNRVSYLADDVANNLFCGVFGDPANAQAEIKFANTILYGNSAYYQVIAFGGGKLTSLGYNYCDLKSKFTSDDPNDIRDNALSLQFKPLTQVGLVGVHYISGSSPTIDTANPTNFPAFDALGNKRPFGGRADMGAVESTISLSMRTTYKNTNALYFTTYVFPTTNTTTYIIEYCTNLSSGHWTAWTNRAINQAYFNRSPYPVGLFLPPKEGPDGLTNNAYFYRVRLE